MDSPTSAVAASAEGAAPVVEVAPRPSPSCPAPLCSRPASSRPGGAALVVEVAPTTSSLVLGASLLDAGTVMARERAHDLAAPTASASIAACAVAAACATLCSAPTCLV